MKIEGNKGVISIKTDGFLSCLLIHKPQVIDWLAVNGSIERYYICLPFREETREVIQNITDLVQRLGSLEEFIESGFLDLLEDGEYDFKIRREVDGVKLIFNTNLYNTNLFVKNNNEVIQGCDENDKTKKITKLYWPHKNTLTFTRSIESLDQKRISYYESSIRNGERPKLIVLRNKFIYDEKIYGEEFIDYSANYVLDGHHKLVAYRSLGICPDLIQIDRLRSYDLRKFDFDILHVIKESLYTCQFNHIISNGFRVDFSEEKLYENEIDEYLSESNILDEVLLEKIGDMIRLPSFFDREEWALKRVEVLKKRVEKKADEIYLEYFDGDKVARKRKLIECWEEIELIMGLI